MNSLFGFSVSIGMLATAGGMMFYENTRWKAGRPLSKNEAIAIPYWIAYLTLLVLGACFMLAAFIR